MLTTQRHLLGLYCEIEVAYSFDADERGTFVELDEVWILGYYPEGCESDSVRRSDYVSINAKADIAYLTSAEIEDLEAACLAHAKVCATDVDYE
jgi:hypothetical protein